MVVGVLLLPWHLHMPSILSETGRRTSTETCGLDMFPPDARLETHFMFDRPWARGVHHAPPPHPYKTIFFWTLGVSRIRNEMLTVKILGLTTDLQLFSKGTLKTRIPNYCAAKIFLWHLWPCNSAPYILNDLNLVSIERWVFYLSYQHKIETKWPPGVKLQLF